MVIDIDMDEMEYLSSLCLGYPYQYINTLEEQIKHQFLLDSEDYDY